MTQAALGYGAELRVGIDTAATSATILLAGIKDVRPPPFTRELVDITNGSSPNGFREYLAGLKDGGELSLSLVWYPGNSTDDVIEEMKTEGIGRVFEVRFTQVSPVRAYTFTAFLKDWDVSTSAEEAMMLSITLKLTGDVVVA